MKPNRAIPHLLAIGICLMGHPFTTRLAGAQQLPVRTGTPASYCQFDTAAHRDTADYTLFLTPPRSVPEAARRPESYTPYIHAIASTFEQPPHLTLASWPGTSLDDSEQSQDSARVCGPDRPWCTAGPLDGEFQFPLRNGRAGPITWRVPLDSPEAMHAMGAAIRQADSLRLFPTRSTIRGLPEETVRLGIRLERRQELTGGVPIGRIRLPYVRATAPPEVLHQPRLSFPPAAGLVERGGVVTLEFVIAEDGRVPEETLRVLELNHTVFLGPARRAILASQFKPARVDTCPIRMLVQQRVVFQAR